MVKAVYTEDVEHLCDKCVYSEGCSKEGYCKCDEYREDNDIYNVEGDFYFIEDKEV